MVAVLQLTISDIEHLYAVRYLALCGISVLVYDTFLTFQEELSRVWLVKSVPHQRLIQVAYFIVRYGNWVFAFFYILQLVIPPENMTNERVSYVLFVLCLRSSLPIYWGHCFRAAAAVFLIDILAFACGNALVLYQLLRLWDAGKALGWFMALGFIAANITMTVCVILTIVTVRQDNGVVFTAVENIKTCNILVNPKTIIGGYIPAVALEIYSFLLLFFNTISRPRSATQKLVSLLYKDGLVFFLVTLSTRLLNLVLNLAAPTSLAVLGISFGASLYSVTIARLHLRMSTVAQFTDVDSLTDSDGLIEEHELDDCIKRDKYTLQAKKIKR